jgi:hypothetical protein
MICFVSEAFLGCQDHRRPPLFIYLFLLLLSSRCLNVLECFATCDRPWFQRGLYILGDRPLPSYLASGALKQYSSFLFFFFNISFIPLIKLWTP